MSNLEKDYFARVGEYGQLIVISGPRSVGKRTLVKEYLKQHPKAIKLPTVTTREKRPEEVEGVEHYFISTYEFDQMIRSHQLIDYTYYNRIGYGTTMESIEKARKEGRNVLLIDDVTEAIHVKLQCPDATLIFIIPPSWDELQERLIARHKDNPKLLEESLLDAQEEILCADQFDYVLINDTVEQTVNRMAQIIHGLRYSKNSMKNFCKAYVQSEIKSDFVDEVKKLIQ